jgi:hypothetical protein
MIRFIDIRNQGTGNRFAFYNTVNGRFVEAGGEMAWESLEEFRLDCDDENIFKRCSNVCADWVNDGEKDDIEGFYDR